MRITPLIAALVGVMTPLAAVAHVTVWPRQSELGAHENYVVRAPNEKKVATVRIEGAFPREARVTTLEQVPGWAVEVKRDGAGDIVGATWTGDLPPGQRAEFGLQATNPSSGTALIWTFSQIYADGSRVDWAGPPGSKTPAPQVQLRPAQAGSR